MNNIKIRRLVSVGELCQTIGVSRSTIYEWRKVGRLPEPVKRWGSPRYDWDEVEQSLKKSPKVSDSD